MAKPKASATVLLVRDASHGLELLMARRLIQGDHMGGAFIFPGGGLDPVDALPEVQAHLVDWDAKAASQSMGLPVHEAAALHLAACREAFEEVGIVLGSCEASQAHLNEARQALATGRLDWVTFLAQSGARFNGRALRYFAHWITPEGFKKRYATRFFIAEVGPEVEAIADEGEVSQTMWVRPQEALAASKEGKMPMVFPTRHALRWLLPYKHVAEVMQAIEGSQAPPDFLPRAAQHGDRVLMLLPGEPGYAEAPPSGLRFDPLSVEGLGW